MSRRDLELRAADAVLGLSKESIILERRRVEGNKDFAPAFHRFLVAKACHSGDGT
jgi:hypothetical protein